MTKYTCGVTIANMEYEDRDLIQERYLDFSLIHRHCVVQVVEVLNKMRKHSLETYYHLVHVANIAGLIAQDETLGLDREAISRIYTAGLLHDIGKLAVSANLLHSKCDENGKELIQQTHIIEGKKMLDEILWDDRIVEIACHHHERLDGSGYPQGLKDKDLSLEDRIVQVADVASALTMPRSYKDGYLDKTTAGKILTSIADRGLLDSRLVAILNGVLAKENITDELLK